MATKDEVIYPLFANGPLKGEEHEVPISYLSSGIKTLDRKPNSMMRGMPVVTYRFYRIGLLGQIIWVGATKDVILLTPEEQADLFKQIVSVRAIKAMKEPPGV